VKVRVGVLMWARIAAPDVAARDAHAQVRPGILTVLGAFLTALWCGRLRLVGLGRRGQVLARLRRGILVAPPRSPQHAVQG
jgi:hypothetical protein